MKTTLKASVRYLAFLTVLAITPTAQAVTVHAEGSSIIQGGKNATQQQLSQARLDAIADALRNIAVAQSTQITSHSLMTTDGSLSESVHLSTQSPIQNMSIYGEDRLGGLYRVKVKALLKSTEKQKSDLTSPQQCQSAHSPLKREVSIQLTPSNLTPSAIKDDINAVLISAKEILKNKVNNSTDLIYSESQKSGLQTSHYAKSYLMAKRPSNEHVLKVSAVRAGDMFTLSVGGYDEEPKTVAGKMVGFGKAAIDLPLGFINTFLNSNVKKDTLVGIRITLPNGGYYTKALGLNESASLSATSDERRLITQWVNNIWPSIDGALSCYPVVAKTRKLNQNAVRLSLGSNHGLSEGQHLLLLDEKANFNVRSNSANMSSMNLYTVEKLAANHASIKPIAGDLPIASSGQKIVVSF